jgi:serralysin
VSYEGLIAYAASPAFVTTLAGSGSDESLIRLLYRNVVSVEPSVGDVTGFASLLADGTFTRSTLAMFAAESILNADNINLTGLAQTGWEYLPPG